MTYLDLVQRITPELENKQHLMLCELAMEIDRLENNVRENAKDFAEKVTSWQKRIEKDRVRDQFSYPSMLQEIARDQAQLEALFLIFRHAFKAGTGTTLSQMQEELVNYEGEGVPSLTVK